MPFAELLLADSQRTLEMLISQAANWIPQDSCCVCVFIYW